MSFLLDTNIISGLRKKGGNHGLLDWYSGIPVQSHYLSVLVLGEIRQGITGLRRKNDERQARALEEWFHKLQFQYQSRILAVDTEVAIEWGALTSIRPLPAIDGLLAATALVHRLTLVTRNSQDFADTGAELLNPFS